MPVKRKKIAGLQNETFRQTDGQKNRLSDNILGVRICVPSPVKGIEKITLELWRGSRQIRLYFDNIKVAFKKGTHRMNTYTTTGYGDIHFQVKHPWFTFYPVLLFDNKAVRFSAALSFYEVFLIYYPFALIFLLGCLLSVFSAVIWLFQELEYIQLNSSLFKIHELFTMFVFYTMIYSKNVFFSGVLIAAMGVMGMFINSLLIRLPLPYFFRAVYCISLSLLALSFCNYLFFIVFKTSIFPY